MQCWNLQNLIRIPHQRKSIFQENHEIFGLLAFETPAPGLFALKTRGQRTSTMKTVENESMAGRTSLHTPGHKTLSEISHYSLYVFAALTIKEDTP